MADPFPPERPAQGVPTAGVPPTAGGAGAAPYGPPYGPAGVPPHAAGPGSSGHPAPPGAARPLDPRAGQGQVPPQSGGGPQFGFPTPYGTPAGPSYAAAAGSDDGRRGTGSGAYDPPAGTRAPYGPPAGPARDGARGRNASGPGGLGAGPPHRRPGEERHGAHGVSHHGSAAGHYGPPPGHAGPAHGPYEPPYEPPAGPSPHDVEAGPPYGPDAEPSGAGDPDTADTGRRARRLPVRPSLSSLRTRAARRRDGGDGRDGDDGDDDGGVPEPRAPGATSPAVYFVAAGVLLVVALVAAAAFVLLGRGAPKNGGAAQGDGAAAGPLPAAYSMASSTKVFAPIARRAADPRPLTAAQVADPKTINDKDAKASLKLTAAKLDARCSAAVWGDRLAALLSRSGCTQASRVVYAGKRYAAMVTIFNLADATGADQVVAAVDPRAGDGFPQSPTASVVFGQGFSTARGVAMGHYAVITWIRRADGSGSETDTGLVSLLVTIGPPQAILDRVAYHGDHGYDG